MKENADRLLERIVEKAVKSSGIESPSDNFTSMVMVHVQAKGSVTVYKPLISKTGWLVIATCVIAFMVYFYIISGVESNDWFKKIDFSVLSNNRLTLFFSNLKLTQVTFYAMLACGLMLCAQIPILKYFIDKRANGFN